MEKGLTYTSSITVNEQNTAAAMGSGDLQVFATPSLVALMENAAMNAVKPFLEAGSTTVGAQIDASHLKPSGIGETVKATATLQEVNERKLTFCIEASDSKGVVGKATHTRYIVDAERFMSKL